MVINSIKEKRKTRTIETLEMSDWVRLKSQKCVIFTEENNVPLKSKGQKWGPLEQDPIIAHGGSKFMKERMCCSSDNVHPRARL